MGALSVLCAACAHAPEDGATSSSLAFSCSGAEPFWSLEITGRSATLTTPDEEDINIETANGSWADSDLSDGAVTWRGDGFTYDVNRGQCFSEAGVEHDYEIDLAPLFPKSPRAPGCCRRVR